MSGMMSAGPPPGAGDEDNIFSRDRETSAGKWGRRAVVLGIIALVLVGVWLWLQGGEDRALNALAPTQRQALFQETRESYRLLCLSDAGSRFAGRCQQQAAFLVRFPDCDDACRRELGPWLPGPTR